MKREKKLTKRERKAASPKAPARAGGDEHHIHCIACGRHLDPAEFEGAATATEIRCAHGSSFPTCTTCTAKSKELLAEHDRTGKPPKTAAAWH